MDEIIIDLEAYRKMETAAKDGYPHESCAILLGAGNVISDIKIIKEGAGSCMAESFYQIDPLKLYEIEKETERRSQKIIGFFHTHTFCEALLSDEDKNYMIPEMIYVVLSLTETTVNRLKGYKKETENERIKEYEVKMI